MNHGLHGIHGWGEAGEIVHAPGAQSARARIFHAVRGQSEMKEHTT
jgi:hypothetical protein